MFDIKIINPECVGGKKVLVRIGADLPIDNGEIRDDFRLKKIIPTLNLLKESGAKSLLLTHLGSDGGSDVSPIVDYFNKNNFKVEYADSLERAGKLLEKIESGEFVMLKNIRAFDGEVENEEGFTRDLASLGDVYVNEAFSVSHREHASIVGIPKLLPSYVGLLFEEEVKHLSEAFNPKRPFLFILGGAKFETKLPLVKKFLSVADSVYLCGALSNDVFKERGFEIGKSRFSGFEGVDEISKHANLQVPVDVVVETENGEIVEKMFTEVDEGDQIIDAGKESLKQLKLLVEASKFVLWNGPLGFYEKEGGEKGTKKLAKIIADDEGRSIIGGGDTLASVAKLGLYDKYDFVSTGGGAMLDFLANETLPGIEALRNN